MENENRLERPFNSAQEFQLDESNVWWVRFSLDFRCNFLACGTKNGKVFVWDPNNTSKQPLCKVRRGASTKMTVRSKQALPAVVCPAKVPEVPHQFKLTSLQIGIVEPSLNAVQMPK